MMSLSTDQIEEFRTRGILKLPGIVPEDLIVRSRRAVNANIGEKGIPPDHLSRFRAQSFCPELGSDPVITNLYNESPIRAIAEAMIGTGKVRPVTGGQIALRFPSPNLAEQPRIAGPHIDGMYSPTNGVKEGTIANFTALVGVFLSDLPEPYSGNFTIWPGTHQSHADYFRDHGPQALLEGMPKVDLPEPEQFIGKAGDAALVHYLLAHSIANNISPNIRYAIFFRLTHVEHESMKWESMVDPYLEWDGLRRHVPHALAVEVSDRESDSA